jgi:hypothetical protein
VTVADATGGSQTIPPFVFWENLSSGSWCTTRTTESDIGWIERAWPRGFVSSNMGDPAVEAAGLNDDGKKIRGMVERKQQTRHIKAQKLGELFTSVRCPTLLIADN